MILFENIEALAKHLPFLISASGFYDILTIVLAVIGVKAGIVILFIAMRYVIVRVKLNYHRNISDEYTDLMSMRELKRHMKNLASKIDAKNKKLKIDIVRTVNRRSYRELKKLKRALSAMPGKIINLVPSAKWLFDNYYLIYKELKAINSISINKTKKDFPVVLNGTMKGYYRIYAIARQIAASSSNHLDRENLIELLNTYQSTTPLKSIELWAFPSILKGCIIEEILEASGDVLENMNKKIRADILVDTLSSQMRTSDKTILELLKESLDRDDINDCSFMSHILYRLKNISADEDEIIDWICEDSDYETRGNVNVISEIIHRETTLEAVHRNKMRLLITSLKKVSELSWEEIFEEISPIEKFLRDDPSGIYKQMDFETRDFYRHKIEKTAKNSGLEESRIAKKALFIAINESKEDKKAHIGHYIVGEKRKKLYKSLRIKQSLWQYIKNFFRKIKGGLYFAGLFALYGALGAGFYFYIDHFFPGREIWEIAVFMIAALIPLSVVCSEIINRISTSLVSPVPVPSMDFTEDIPDRYRTFVVMPVLLGSVEQVEDYTKKLERYYLGNMQDNLYFAILGDFKDAKSRQMPEDKEILSAAEESIENLNKKYPCEHPKFNLFVRYRKYNESEGCWMGWERKRGKLEEFNALLLGEEKTSYETILCDKKILDTFRYVITLDSDTELIRESAVRLVGIMAHPLNRPVMNEKKNKIERGYSIVQSEIRNKLSSVKFSVFSSVFANNPGIDTYSSLVSDVYHDTFNEGIFYGKGIYDIKMFHRLFNEKIPENKVLSHDLLESSYARCAFAGGVKLMDTYPSGLYSYIKREHRWIRGDWQLLPWLFIRSPIGLLSKWKILDNMRRSLTPASWFLLILINLVLFPQQPFIWMFFVFFSPILQSFSKLRIIYEKIRNPQSAFCFKNIFIEAFKTIFQGFLIFTLIPLRAYTALDAMFRSFYRMLISHKKMLEWATAESVEKKYENTLIKNIFFMFQSVIAGIIILLAIVLNFSPGVVVISSFVGFTWIVSPAISYFINKPRETKKKIRPEQDDLTLLRRQAIKIWKFVQENASEETNWICPDNLQTEPIKKITAKTSPTNLGLQLMSVLTARDLGFIGNLYFVGYCEKLLETINSMEKWNGHLYNWYNIETLEVITPRYISTVDSGNFVGYMITLKNALCELADMPVFSESLMEGLKDKLQLSGIDYSIESEEFTKENFESVLIKLKSLTEEDTKAWEDEKWKERLNRACVEYLDELEHFDVSEEDFSRITFSKMAESGNKRAEEILEKAEKMAENADSIVRDTNFRPLYDENQCLFRIGYNTDLKMLDPSKYDLLASESRQASFIAVAKGDVPQKHWFRLGRPLTIANHMQSLVSWSGSMFEYLMPELIMKSYPNSVISQSCLAMVVSQINYGKRKDVPWGISESQYYRFDADSNYQYRAFGISDLSFQSSMQNELVITPYATLLALNYLPEKTISNMKKLIEMGVESEYGFYEAVDFTVPDTSEFKRYTLVKSYMMHHQGMSLVSINNALNDYIMQKRFHKEPIVQATEILLEEYNSMSLFTLDNKEYNLKISPNPYQSDTILTRYFNKPVPDYPCAHVLCNDRYMLMMTTAGSGFSKCKDIMINRWRPDPTYDLHGMFFYIRNLNTKSVWSSYYYPRIKEPENYETIFSPDKIEYIRTDEGIKTHSEITVSPLDNVEVRSMTFSNESGKEAQLEVTSYFELVNDTYESDLAHPAFSKLFNETEYNMGLKMIVGKRRPRESSEKRRFVVHFVLCQDKILKGIEYETDKKKFEGRGKTPENPDAVTRKFSLSNTDGQTTDPILSLRVSISVAPGKKSTVSYITGYCERWSDVIGMHRKYAVDYSLKDVFELARVNSELEMLYLDMDSHQVNMIQDVVGSLYYPSKHFRADESVIKRNKKDQTALWRFGISGDNPIMLLRIKDKEDRRTAEDVVMAYEFFKKNMIKVDVVILDEQIGGYAGELNNMLSGLTNNMRMYDEDPAKRNLFILKAENMNDEEKDLLMSTASLVINAEDGFSGWFKAAVTKSGEEKIDVPRFEDFKTCDKIPAINAQEEAVDYALTGSREMYKVTPEFYNNMGGFVNNGEEYRMKLRNGIKTPMPWINVVSGEDFGFFVSESGSGYTWAENSRENKLTKWSNNPVSDPPSEIVYIRDDETGEYTTTTSSPIDDQGLYSISHGHGYSVFEHESLELKQRMTVFAAEKDPVKLWRIKMDNTSHRTREISVILYVEWVMGVSREKTAPYLVTDMDTDTNAFTVKNVYTKEFPERTAFISSDEKIESYTGDRKEVIGIKGSYSRPCGIWQKKFSDRAGAGSDPCGAISVKITIEPGKSRAICFFMGHVKDEDQIAHLTEKFSTQDYVKYELDRVKTKWKKLLGQIKVKTPDRAMNILINEWLLYQVVSCRLNSRAALYQCGGAFGFRDQLQDVMALLYADPKRVRDQILLCSSRQFKEGDVQHWWHHHSGTGVRTRITDDLLWLPYVTAKYIEATGDYAVLEEKTDYITGPLLEPHEAEKAFIPGKAYDPESLYEHCIKAIERTLSFGERNLPLIGSGDWNDGMNRVGIKGKGESVWLGWFLNSVLNKFQPLCKDKKDYSRADKYEKIAREIVENIEKHAWDGKWYLRAFFDDGSTLGSEENQECKIDSISQSWSVISGGAGKQRAYTAIDSAHKHLVREEDGVICLLDPPFDTVPKDPGYIKGYYPGVRENGGQYTHAAIWLAMAKARLKDGDGAYKLFSMINPVNTSSTYKGAMKYEQEPYVITADIYSKHPHAGKGGWSWYTGSAGWMYTALITEILGIKKKGDKMYMEPVIPSDWSGFTIEYTYGETKYNIEVENPENVSCGCRKLVLDKQEQKDNGFNLVDDGEIHTVKVVLGKNEEEK